MNFDDDLLSLDQPYQQQVIACVFFLIVASSDFPDLLKSMILFFRAVLSSLDFPIVVFVM